MGKSKYELFKEFLENRLGISSLRYPIPSHGIWVGYSLGAITLFSFVIQALTGILLGFFYSPIDPVGSISSISNDLIWGFIRSLHWWNGNLIPVLLLVHMFRIVVTGSYKKPRELTWVIGVLMGATVILGSLYTGTILKWDQEGYEAYLHLIESFSAVGGLGEMLISLFNLNSLVVIYFLHVSVLPLIVLGLFAIHAVLIRIHEISDLPGLPSDKTSSKFTFIDHVKYATLYSLCYLGILVILAVLFPTRPSLAPIPGVELTYPPWIFVPLMPFEALLGASVILAIPTLLILGLLAVPFYDRDDDKNFLKGRQFKVFLFLLSIITFIVIVNLISLFVSFLHSI